MTKKTFLVQFLDNPMPANEFDHHDSVIVKADTAEEALAIAASDESDDRSFAIACEISSVRLFSKKTWTEE